MQVYIQTMQIQQINHTANPIITVSFIHATNLLSPRTVIVRRMITELSYVFVVIGQHSRIIVAGLYKS